MSCIEERKPLMIACHGVPWASAAAQPMALAEVSPDTRLERGSPTLRDALGGVRPRQLPVP
jgi:hypothetical protein